MGCAVNAFPFARTGSFWWYIFSAGLLHMPLHGLDLGVAAVGLVLLMLMLVAVDLHTAVEAVRAEVAGESEDARAKLETEIAELHGRLQDEKARTAAAVGEAVVLRLRLEAAEKERVKQ